MNMHGFPVKQGLYDPSMEKDSCGVGFITNINGEKSHKILKQALEILGNMKHRGAVGSDPTTGDGSGILIQIPHEFFEKETSKSDFKLPGNNDYAVGMVFLPQEPNARLYCEGIIEKVLRVENLDLIGTREVPVNERACGDLARATRPVIMQFFIDRSGLNEDEFERRLYIVRKRIQNVILEQKRPYTESFYICSLSSRTIIFKGLILGYMLDEFFIDLKDKTIKTSIAVVHERYSTNTFPAWKLAQPFRYLAHNGEINTIKGNVNWMNAREGVMQSKIMKEELKKILPVIELGGSDSSYLDNVLELFIANGHQMENAMTMLIPEAWQKDMEMDKSKRAYFEYNSRLMEPWDGPATAVFTDGIKIGVILDRNGLRPARYILTKEDVMIMASEVGVTDIKQEDIKEKGYIEPGKLLLIDTKGGRIISDDEIKMTAAKKANFADWIGKNKLTLSDIKQGYQTKKMRYETLKLKQKIYGFSEEEMNKVIAYMAENGSEPISSMGIDTPLAVLSNKPQLLFDYFKQTFAQVTNPPIDAIREDNIMSLVQFMGSHGKLLDEVEIEKDYKYIELKHPVLYPEELEDLRHLYDEDFKAITIPIVFEIDRENGLKEALDNLCKRAEESARDGYNIIILSDRNIDRYNLPIPSLLALGAVHYHLIRKKLRTCLDIVIEAGDARDVMHIALLVGYGAKAVNPYMVFETIDDFIEKKRYIKNVEGKGAAFKNYIDAIYSGLLKIISRMGISTLQSYCGAQVFQAIGLNKEVIDEYFNDTPSRIPCMGLNDIAREIKQRYSLAYEGFGKADKSLDNKDEYHILNPGVVRKLHRACFENDYNAYKEYSREVDEKGENIATIRGLLRFKHKNPINIGEVEPVESILKRFVVAGMSFGSLSKEAHETFAIAMNRIGGKSNSGEGGEDPEVYSSSEKEKDMINKVKQVASGRFGVTINYLVNCDEIQIKVAQGAKPGEGGHLPGSKVTPQIAKIRHSIPGIDLISPPPHHDIYSIEDLAQLIFDLKNANPKAKISVKLVSEVGIGTVSAGVAKGHADVIVISGHDGGSGAAPISSMKYVGMPWELGLAEAQQTLLLNNLRSRVTIQVDGKMKTGRDVVIAALLGAEEFGFATTALISIGCLMCRQCHLNRCQVGIATQDPKLRKKFEGKPYYVIYFMKFVAQEIREIMAELGFKTMDEMIGRVDLLEARDIKIDKLKGLDLSDLLYIPELPSRIKGKYISQISLKIDDVIDRELIRLSKPALEKRLKIEGSYKIKNTDRAVGTMLSGEIAKSYGDEGLPKDTISVTFNGSAGQSFGAFLIKGVKFLLQGDANDYLGKGLCGGKIILMPPAETGCVSDENMIAGNTLLYGATSGELYARGKVGQRFCVRNSGATAVVEGIGNHGCEYMTGGTVIILGPVGKNFGAGMSGGVAYVLDDGNFKNRCNKQIVELNTLNSKDMDLVKKLIEKHYNYTSSKKAKDIIDNWDDWKVKFIKVSSPVYLKKLEENNNSQLI